MLHIISSLGRGGAERCVVELLRLGDRSQFSPSVVCIGSRDAYSDQIERLGVPLHHLDIKTRGVICALKELHSLRKALLPSIVSTWLYHADLVGTLLWLASRRSFRLVWNVRRTIIDDEIEPLHRRVVRRLLSLLSWAPTLIIANSMRGVRSHTDFGYSPSEWCVIPNGVDTHIFQASMTLRETFRRVWKIQEDEILLLCVGRLSQVKGQDRALEAYRTLRRLGRKVRLLFVGRGISSWNVDHFPGIAPPVESEGVILIDEVSDLVGMYSAADILVLPSRAEGHPQVVTEALACELPVVSFDVGDVRSILDPCGATAESLTEFIAHLERFVRIPTNQRRSLGIAGREKILKSYRLESMVERFERILSGLIRGATPATASPRLLGGE